MFAYFYDEVLGKILVLLFHLLDLVVESELKILFSQNSSVLSECGEEKFRGLVQFIIPKETVSEVYFEIIVNHEIVVLLTQICVQFGNALGVFALLLRCAAGTTYCSCLSFQCTRLFMILF